MQQYFAKNKNLKLEKKDYHHIKNVMRMKKGDYIKVVYENVIYKCKITNLDNDVLFDIIEKKEDKNKISYQITLAFSLIKEQKLNYLLQKSTEVGVDCFMPIKTSRTIVKIEDKKNDKKLTRWRLICKEASEQSNRVRIPKISEISNLKDLINEEYDLKLLCSLNKNTKNIKKVLQKSKKCVKILLVVGPEGGFTSDEENYLINNGFISVSLGSNVLRAETAPVAAISMINYEFMR